MTYALEFGSPIEFKDAKSISTLNTSIETLENLDFIKETSLDFQSKLDERSISSNN